MEIFDKLWVNYQKKFPIEAEHGTIWHGIAWLIHKCARITSLLPASKIIKPVALKPINYKTLKNKHELYKILIKNHQDQHGFIMTDECDSLLFSSLMSATGMKIDINVARDVKGYWHRRPFSYEKCWKGKSYDGSTISRDMLVGLLWHLYHRGKKEDAELLYQFAKEHNFIMGQGDPSRLILMPGLEATLADIIQTLGGSTSKYVRNMSQSWPKTLQGFELHLLLLHSILRADIKGYISPELLDVYKYYAEKAHYNPLCHYALHRYTDGDMNPAVERLLDEKIWPHDRLPKRKDRASGWVTERACGKDWQPSTVDPEHEHTGGDFIFASWLILRHYTGR